VQLARHKKTGSLYALKLINLYDKSIRDMLLTELTALFKSDCEALIDFHGATVRDSPRRASQARKRRGGTSPTRPRLYCAVS